MVCPIGRGVIIKTITHFNNFIYYSIYHGKNQHFVRFLDIYIVI